MRLPFRRALRRTLWTPVFRLKNSGKPRFECPVCGYRGPFEDIHPTTGARKHAQCPSCDSLERHRLQYLVLQSVLRPLKTSAMTMLHVAPEPFFRDFFAARFGNYQTADAQMRGVDHQIDLQNLSLPDTSYDFVFASHVLEHIPDDRRAVQEIRRILRPSGIAVLPVPIVCEKTVEYDAPDPQESGHVRAPGLDYFDRYKASFSRVELFSSETLPEKHQLFVYEDRTGLPPRKSPRTELPGGRLTDIVPVCYA